MYKNVLNICIVGAAFFFLLLMSLHYPAASSAPMGGDAAAYARQSQVLLRAAEQPGEAWQMLRTSNYPLMPALFATTKLLPTSWPNRFVWAMSLGHVAAGLAIGWLLWRIHGWSGAAAGMAVWALTTVDSNRHFEDGTLAQLWSLPLLVLGFERLLAGSVWATLGAFVLVWLIHPLTGLVGALSLAVAWPMLAAGRLELPRAQQKMVWMLVPLLAIILTLALRSLAGWPMETGEDHWLWDVLKSSFAPWLFLGLFGSVWLAGRTELSRPVRGVLLSWVAVSILLALSAQFGAGMLAYRFHTYLIVVATTLGALGLVQVARVSFPSWLWRGVFISLLFATVGTASWQRAHSTYAYYESRGRYAHLDPLEAAAFTWMGEALPADSHILTTADNRNSEWIPVFSGRAWTERARNDAVFLAEGEELRRMLVTGGFTHVAFLTRREKVLDEFPRHLEWYPVVFRNASVTIFKVN